MTAYAFPDLFALIVNMLFGIYVYLKNPKALSTRVVAALALTVCLWQFGEFNLVRSRNPSAALFWDRFLYVGLILAPNVSLALALVFPRRRAFLKSGFRVFLLFLPSLFLLSLLPTDFFILGIQREYWGFGKVAGPLFWLFRVHLSVFIGLTLVTFYHSYRTAKTGRERVQSKYLMAAIGIPGVVGALILIVLQPAGLNYLNMSVAALASIMATAILTYAIVKDRLMDVDVVLKKSTVYALSLVAVLAPALAVILFIQYRSFGQIHYVFSFLVLIVISLSCYLFSTIKPRAEETIERAMFGEKYLYRAVLRGFSKEILTMMDLEVLCRRAIDLIIETMGIRSASIVLYQEEKNDYALQELRDHRERAQQHDDLVFPARGDALINWLEKNRQVFVREEWERTVPDSEVSGAVDQMRRMASEICIPLLRKERLIGFINLGKKSGMGVYSDDDLDLLQTLANQAAIAIENAKLYEDLKKQKAVMRRADRLASLGTLTAGLAHEIRNPLVAIKTLTQLLPERLDDEEFRRDFLSIASGEVDRISSLVNELLEFARPTEPHFQLQSIPEIMDGMLLLVSTELKKKNIEVSRRCEENLPSVPVDGEQIKQVFLNVLLNAIEATDEGGRVSVEIRTFLRKNGEKFLQVEVTDTGRGIAEEHLDYVFIPFFTTKDKGSGLGLSISHQIVQEHGGVITVESRLGHGASFFVNLPLSQRTIEGAALERGEARVPSQL